MAKLTTNQIADNAITSAKLDTDIAITNLTVTGELNIGSVSEENISQNVLEVGNYEIKLNANLSDTDSPNPNGGKLTIVRGNQSDTSFFWNEERDRWQLDQDLEMYNSSIPRYIKFARSTLHAPDYGGILFNENYSSLDNYHFKIYYDGRTNYGGNGALLFHGTSSEGNLAYINRTGDFWLKKDANIEGSITYSGDTYAPDIKLFESDETNYASYNITSGILDYKISRPGGIYNWYNNSGATDNLMMTLNSSSDLNVKGNIKVDGVNSSYIAGKLTIGTSSIKTSTLYAEGDVQANDGAFIISRSGTDNIDHIWHNDTDNMWYFVSDGVYKSTTSLSKLRASDIYLNNKLGIGTTSPYYKTDIRFSNADTSFSGGSSGNWGSNGLRIENTNTSVNTMSTIQLRNGDADIHIAGIRQASNDSDLGLFFEGAEKFRFTNDGKLNMTNNLELGSSSNIKSIGNSNFQITSYGDITLDIDSNSNSDNYFKITRHNQTENLFLLDESGNATMVGNLTLNSAYPEIQFNGTSDGGVDIAIKATPEGLDFYEPEDGNKIHFQILDDTGVNAPYGYKVGGTSVVDSSRNITGSDITATGDIKTSNSFNIQDKVKLEWDEETQSLDFNFI